MKPWSIARKPSWDFHLEWLEFYRAVTDHYGLPWRMTGWEAGQNSYRTFDVGPDGPDGWTLREATSIMADWLSGNAPDCLDTWGLEEWYAHHEPPADVILWHLCLMGHLKPGRYLITKWW